MGIDVYASWPGQTQKERDAQVMHIDVSSGQPVTSWCGGTGYLREGYSLNLETLETEQTPLATRVLVPEAFLAGSGGVQIPAAAMRERLPEALATVRSRAFYRWGEHAAEAGVYAARISKNFRDFVALCERKEKEHGTPCTIMASS